ncbi:MAG TPA: hypothetical protein VIW07_13100 [Candidatus Udaeobacter sp.]|jgi:hypothetical protein
MTAPKPLLDMFCVCDPKGVLVHTTVATDEKSAIEFWMETESAMNLLSNCGRTVRGESQRCLPSWEGFEAEGYRVVRVNLIPTT